MFTDEELVEKLIDEVEKRPVLFNKMCKEYSDVNLKIRKWEEVTMQIVGIVRWGEMSAEEKTNSCKEAQKRWLNLRNCFARELRLQRETKSGQSAKKRRTYVYFERLMFLLPTIDPRETASNISNDSEDGEGTDSSNTKRVRPPRPSPNNSESFEGTDSSNTERVRPPRPSPNNNESFEQSLLKVLERKNIVEQNKINDEDHNFALSLVPMLQRLNVYDKIDAKMQILNIFKEKCAPQPELRKVRILNQQTVPPKTMTNSWRGPPPPAISPGPSQIQYALPQDQMQGPSQPHANSPPPAVSPGRSQIEPPLPEDRMQPTPSPSTIYDNNDSAQDYYSNYFVDDYE